VIRLSASAVPRALACPTSLVLPHEDYRTQYADDGSDRHAEMEDAADKGEHDRLPEAVRALIQPGDHLASECSFAYDVATDTARELGHTKRDYGSYALRPFEIPGTVDLLIAGNGRLVVVDYKSFEEVDAAEDNTQTTTYALMAARTYGYDEVTVMIVYLVANRRPSTFTLTALDLDAHAERLKQLQIDVAAAASDHERYVATGPHCKYCPAYLSCPRQKELKQQTATGVIALRVESMIPLERDEDAADAYELLRQVGLLQQRLRAAIYARAGERPIPLHNGKVLGTRTKNGNDKLDGDIVYEVIKAKYGQSIADAAVVRTATKKRLRDALVFVGAKSVAAAEREVLAIVKDKGGIENKPKTVIEEYEPQPLLKVVNK
jgi:CRISPR/Cas system-associated exonuclease Cas4 (RecB family)